MFSPCDVWDTPAESDRLCASLFGEPETFVLEPVLHPVTSQPTGKAKRKRNRRERNLEHASRNGEGSSLRTDDVSGAKKSKRDRKPVKDVKEAVSTGVCDDDDDDDEVEQDDEQALRQGDKPKRKVPTESYLEKAEKRLRGSRFRMLNEKLYTSTGDKALEFFQSEPAAYEEYHDGYREQIALWPEKPVQKIINWFKKQPKNWIVADFGCGEATLAASVAQKVHSFDLSALNERVVVCNMADVPLDDSTVDVVVFCLSLMGTNTVDFLVEARRVLKANGILKIAEVGSRFDNIKQFIHKIERLGFAFKHKTHAEKDYFLLFEFMKTAEQAVTDTLPDIKLKPCIYKKR